MSEMLEKLEHALDRQMGGLGVHLHTPDPSEECLARVAAAVGQEASRLQRQERRLRAIRGWLSVAAAILLVVVLDRLPASTPAPDLAGADAAEWLSGWTAAVEASSDQVTMLLTDEWWSNGWQTDEDEEQALDELLDSLDQSRSLLLGA